MDRLNEIFGAKWGCDLTGVEGPDVSPFGLRINTARDQTDDFDGSIDSLKLSFNGRWGNYVLQMINMFHLAEKLECKKVYIHRTDVFALSQRCVLHGIVVDLIENASCGEGYQLEGVFFDMRSLKSLVSDLSPQRRRKLALKYIRPLMPALNPRIDVVGREELVIHIRSGDIFQGAEGQGGSQMGGALYIQPPLAFYLIVAAESFINGLTSAVVISENSLNPTIYPLVEELQKIGYAVSLRLNHDLMSDLNYLLAARRAVFANGTIGIAVALISSVITDGYFFEKDGTGTQFDVDCFIGDFIKKHYILSKSGSYIKKGEWKNTVEQRSLMVSLPTSELYWGGSQQKLVNIALNKRARQSSLSTFSLPNESGRAVNGVVDGSCSFHTEREHFPWWEVDFGSVHHIYKLKIHNRAVEPQRAYSMQIYLLDRESQWKLVHDQKGRPFGCNKNNPAVIELDGELGKALRIQLPAYEYLHLNEVEVYGLENI
jgi:hypothetical protein